jgi:divalent metal cation (Fe/Co/Zn/Cd) transporter
MWLLAFALFGGLVWPIFFTVAGFGITLYVIGGILEFLYHAFVGLLNRSKPEKPDPKAKDSETPYR